MKFHFSVLAFFALLSISCGTFAQFANPKTYQECLLSATWNGAANRSNRKLVESECRKRFPKTAPSYQSMAVKLNDQFLSKIDIYPKRSAKNTIEASVYNGNTDVTITQLTVLLTPITARESMEDFFDSEEYEINLEIAPAKTVPIKIEEETKIASRFRWKVLRALGY